MVRRIFNILLFLSFIFMFGSCEKEYEGSKVISIEYTTVDYMGGF